MIRKSASRPEERPLCVGTRRRAESRKILLEGCGAGGYDLRYMPPNQAAEPDGCAAG